MGAFRCGAGTIPAPMTLSTVRDGARSFCPQSTFLSSPSHPKTDPRQIQARSKTDPRQTPWTDPQDSPSERPRTVAATDPRTPQGTPGNPREPQDTPGHPRTPQDTPGLRWRVPSTSFYGRIVPAFLGEGKPPGRKEPPTASRTARRRFPLMPTATTANIARRDVDRDSRASPSDAARRGTSEKNADPRGTALFPGDGGDDGTPTALSGGGSAPWAAARKRTVCGVPVIPFLSRACRRLRPRSPCLTFA